MRRPLLFLLFFPLITPLRAQQTGPQDRIYTVKALDRIARPVLSALAAGELKKALPLGPGEEDRRKFTHLEAFGRTMVGIAPWLALGPDNTPEGKLRADYIAMSRKALINATDSASPDHLDFTTPSQPLVDTAFLALALLRAPDQLWKPLTPAQQANVIAALKETRKIKPGESNWLLFSASVEAAIWHFTGECEMRPITYALEKHQQWYLGDGTYGDGPQFHWDYYNSYVIQPALIAVLEVCKEKSDPNAKLLPATIGRAQRYAEVQERMVSPEGTYPVIGRSSSYRFGAFQVLSLMALRHELPKEVSPAAARGALTAVIRRTLEAPGTFDAKGWLRAGAVGYQPGIRDGYVSTGSLYMCTAGLLHLGLPANDPFWTAPAEPWTQKRIWAGQDIPGDHHYADPKER
ncbi:DUF2264 domain-containing protein [Luteolibacter ambystomatis]|uniref:DUF2264 domain-containing protein n=1 Tax=Luteolibacter ambystomatis TaxID=2824561 RepID=A0A975PG01_9BACT|nr:DUF2264 domain-containing protein [Luteolibacter ambystomatis]QUE52343.1 DUF2264 domain-containing protein [Luteolibacter ambystomatis]